MNQQIDWKEIVDGCKNWNRVAQEKLYRAFARDLLKVCRMYSTDSDEAQDFLHDAFIHIFKQIDRYQEQGQLPFWLRRVTVNVCLQKLREQKKMPEYASEKALVNLADDDEEEVQTHVPFQQVLTEINALPAKAALVLKLYAIEGWSHAEIAEELSISVGTSKSQLNYARSILKAKLK